MNDEPLVSLEELQDRLHFDMDEGEQREATGALEYLSDEAREVGLASWSTPEKAPQTVRSIVLKAAIRFMKQYEALVQSRAGDETAIWSDLGQDMGTAFLNDREIKSLRRIAGQGGIISAPVFAWDDTEKTDNSSELVYATDNDEGIPFFANKDGGFGQ